MDFSLSEEQVDRIERTARFARDVLCSRDPGERAHPRFDRTLWNEAAKFGLAGLPVPVEWGGSGLGPMDVILTIEALGRSCDAGGLVFSLCAHMFACAVPLAAFATGEQREREVRGLAAGTLIGANAITESEAGSDVFSMRTTAVREGDGYLLDGMKCFVTNAPVADRFLVYATTDPRRGLFGITAFLIPGGTAGLRVTEGSPKVGLRASPWGDVHLQECRVPESTRVGPEGSGAAIFGESMKWERTCLFAWYVGAMERSLHECIAHARQRKQFGRRIGENQSVSNRLVDMKLRLETSRLLLYRAGWEQMQRRPKEEIGALSKLWISECAVRSGLDAVQVFGGSGVCSETGVDALLRDAIPARIFSGSSEMQREIVAQSMKLR